MSKRSKKKPVTINSFVNSLDFEKYLKFLNFDYPLLYRQSEVEKMSSVDELFRGKNYLAIIVLNDHLDIGHFVVLRKDAGAISTAEGTAKYVYFDCLADNIPEFITDLINKSSKSPTELQYTTKRLMDRSGIICGKYCLSFAMAGDIKIHDYVDILSSHKKYTADEIVDKLYRLEYTETEIIVRTEESPFY